MRKRTVEADAAERGEAREGDVRAHRESLCKGQREVE